jgi:ligand-binding sensor protein
MDIILDNNKMEKLIYSFSMLTGLTFGIFDTNYKEIILCKKFPAFCELMRSSLQGNQKCLDSDAVSLKIASARKDIYRYRCHAGLVEACAPIIENGEVYGYFVFGQILDETSYESQWETTQECCRWHKDLDLLKKHFFELPRLSNEQITASMEIMKACASYIVLQHIVQSYQQTDAERILNHIHDNFDNNITLDSISTALNMSKTKLCNIAKNQFNSTVGELIIKKRIETAKMYLKTTDLCIYEISCRVGVSDYNYFSRMFKKQEDMSPSHYRSLSRMGTVKKFSDI